MDAFLESARLAGRAPFDGRTLAMPELVALDAAQFLVATAVEVLAGRFGARRLRPPSKTWLHSFADWHEHDGFVSVSQPSSWAALRELVASAETLWARREEDDLVRTAFYTEGGEFLLRIHVADDSGRRGEFDVTAAAADVAAIERELPRGAAGVVAAKAYFDERWGG